jgi:ABC-type Na+ transport system ATPase subunit NatA
MIEARGLVKRYGATMAVSDLSFSVRPGMVTGFLGPDILASVCAAVFASLIVRLYRSR